MVRDGRFESKRATKNIRAGRDAVAESNTFFFQKRTTITFTTIITNTIQCDETCLSP